MWNDGGLWALRLRTGWVNLWLPLPLCVLGDLLASFEDLAEVILPRFGLPNYAAGIHALLRELSASVGSEPVVEIDDGDTLLIIKRMDWRES